MANDFQSRRYRAGRIRIRRTVKRDNRQADRAGNVRETGIISDVEIASCKQWGNFRHFRLSHQVNDRSTRRLRNRE